jgi:hypothetical protein
MVETEGLHAGGLADYIEIKMLVEVLGGHDRDFPCKFFHSVSISFSHQSLRLSMTKNHLRGSVSQSIQVLTSKFLKSMPKIALPAFG